MFENSIIKLIGLLVIIVGGIFIGTYEVAAFFLREKAHRNFWLKIWLALSIGTGIAFWVILGFWENKNFK